MHVFIEVEKDAEKFFEEEFWDKDYKKKNNVDDIPED